MAQSSQLADQSPIFIAPTVQIAALGSSTLYNTKGMDNEGQSSKTRKPKTKALRKSHSQSQPYLLPELLLEILCRLPTKTLLKFRCICKKWRSIIDSSDFIYRHLRLFNNNSKETQLLAVEIHKYVDRYAFYLPGDDTYRFTIRRNDTFRKVSQLGDFGKHYMLLGSCNGLLLMKSFPFGEISREEKMMILWNPCVRKAVVLPVCTIGSSYNNNNPPCFYLGFAPLSNDYKVLALKHVRIGEGGPKVVEVAVYSLNDDIWRIKQINVDEWDLFGLGCGRGCVYVGGIVYWIEFDSFKYGIRSDSERTHLLAFDFETENFSSVQLPFAVKDYDVKFIFLLGESVAIFTLSMAGSCIWVFNKDGGEVPWRLWFSGVSNSDVYDLFKSSVRRPFSNCFFVQKSNTLLMVQSNNKLSKKYPRRLVMSYNIISNEIQLLGKTMRGNIAFDTYVESLMLHKGFDDRRIMTSFPCSS